MSLRTCAIGTGLVLAAVLTGCPSQTPPPAGYRDAIQSGTAVTFIVEFSDGEAVLRRFIAPSRPRGRIGDGRRLRPGRPAADVLGFGEIVASVHDRGGRPLGAIGLQGRPVDFTEAAGRGVTQAAARPGPIRRTSDVRRLVVPIGAEAASIVFYRIDVIRPGAPPPLLPTRSNVQGIISMRPGIVGQDVSVAAPDGAGTYRLRPLGAWLLDPTVDVPTIEVPAVGGAWRLNLPVLDRMTQQLMPMGQRRFVPRDYLSLERTRLLTTGPTARLAPVPGSGGTAATASVVPLAVLQDPDADPDDEWSIEEWFAWWIDQFEPSTDVLHQASTDGETYDIVILGEGFTFDDVEVFELRAREFVAELLSEDGWRPFSTRADLIDVHLVWRASYDGGVEHCPSSASCPAGGCVWGATCPQDASEWDVCSDCYKECEHDDAPCADCHACLDGTCVTGDCGSNVDYCRECGECSADCGTTCDELCADCHDCYADCHEACAPVYDCSDCADEPHDTWLEVRANADGRCSFTDFASDDEALLWDAAGFAVPEDEIDLILVIVNCVFYGGRARAGDSIAYVSVMEDAPSSSTMAEYFTGLAVHESAHAMADLGEEYVSCALPVPGVEFRNQVGAKAAADVHAESVWWADLAGGGLTREGMLETVIGCEQGDTVKDEVGLHWGAQFYEIDDRAGDNWYYGPCDGRDIRLACDWYRPTQRCLMNTWSAKPCPICELVLDEAITAATESYDVPQDMEVE